MAQPLLDALAYEYGTRYGEQPELVDRELRAYPAEEFSSPHGGLVVLAEDDEPIAGGAFRTYDPDTAELKRIWTAAHRRREGLGKVVLAALESRITEQGFGRIYLTTGWRQPEAVALYLAASYQAEFDPTGYPIGEVAHPFTKSLR